MKNHKVVPDSIIMDNSKPSTTTVHGFKFTDMLLVLSFLYMTYSAFQGLLKANNYGTVAFVLTAYTSLILLFWCLREFDKTPEQATKKKECLKVAIATLAMILNVSFTYRVATILDSTVMSAIVWTMAAVMTVGGFYSLFVVPEPQLPST